MGRKTIFIILLAIPFIGLGQQVAYPFTDYKFTLKSVGNVVSKFERDGRIWISYDRKDAPLQTFTPLDSIYECHGKFMWIITDTSISGKIFRIFFGKKWIDIKNQQNNINDPTARYVSDGHIMLTVMAACIDDYYLYCQCQQRFKIINKNF